MRQATPQRRQVRSVPRPVYRQRYDAPRRHRPEIHFTTWQWRLALVGVLIIAAIIALGQLFAIRTISVQPAVRTAVLTPEIRTALRANFWQGNLLTLSSGHLTSDLLAADPTLQQVTITRQWPHGLSVVISEKVASLGWETAGQTFIIDHNGIVLQPAQSTAHLTIVQDDSNLPVHPGQQVVTPQFVTFCQQLEEQIPNTGLTLTKLEIHDTTFDLYATTNRGYQIIFDTSRAVGPEINDLKATLKALVQQHATPSQYIDLRIAGRAYYQ